MSIVRQTSSNNIHRKLLPNKIEKKNVYEEQELT